MYTAQVTPFNTNSTEDEENKMAEHVDILKWINPNNDIKFVTVIEFCTTKHSKWQNRDLKGAVIFKRQ